MYTERKPDTGRNEEVYIMPKPDDSKKESYLEIIDRLIRETKYGTVTVIIQDGKVIQVEKTDKIRLQN